MTTTSIIPPSALGGLSTDEFAANWRRLPLDGNEVRPETRDPPRSRQCLTPTPAVPSVPCGPIRTDPTGRNLHRTNTIVESRIKKRILWIIQIVLQGPQDNALQRIKRTLVCPNQYLLHIFCLPEKPSSRARTMRIRRRQEIARSASFRDPKSLCPGLKSDFLISGPRLLCSNRTGLLCLQIRIRMA